MGEGGTNQRAEGPKWPASARIRGGEKEKWDEKKAETDLNGRLLSKYG